MKTVLIQTVMIAALLCGACTSATESRDEEKLRVANEMIQSWNEMDWERMFSLFAEYGVMHSMMQEPIVGREAIREHFMPLFPALERIEFQVANLGVIGDVVVVERVDDFDYDGRHARVPTVGVLVIENGKVREWSDCYDRATMEAALGLKPADAVDRQGEDAAALQVGAVIEGLQTTWNAGDMDGYLGAFSRVIKRSDDGGWLIVHEHTSRAQVLAH